MRAQILEGSACADVEARSPGYFRRQGLLDEFDAAGMLTWQGSGGFSVDAFVRIEGERARLQPRPCLTRESPLYRFPKPDIHGRTELLLTPLDRASRRPIPAH